MRVSDLSLRELSNYGLAMRVTGGRVAVVEQWLRNCALLEWPTSYVRSQLRLVEKGYKGLDLHDHTCHLLLNVPA